MNGQSESGHWLQGREIQIITWAVVAWLVYALVNTAFSIFEQHIAPLLAPGSPRPGLPWPFMIMTLSLLVLNLVLGGMALRGLRNPDAKGFRWSTAFLAYVVLMNLIGIIQLSIMRLPPDNQPLLLVRPWDLVRGATLILVATAGMVLLFRTAVMNTFNITVEQKGKQLAKVAGLGFLLMLANIALAMATSGIAVLILE